MRPIFDHPDRLGMIIDGLRDSVRTYAEAEGLSSRETAVALFACAHIMLEMNFGTVEAPLIAGELTAQWLLSIRTKLENRGPLQ